MTQPNDGEWGPWIDWAGGECPIKDERWQVRLRDVLFVEKPSLPSNYRWDHSNQNSFEYGFDIIAYRVLQQDDMLARAIEALRRADMFITNGVENGYIRLPSPPDPALETPSLIRSILAAYDKRGK